MWKELYKIQALSTTLQMENWELHKNQTDLRLDSNALKTQATKAEMKTLQNRIAALEKETDNIKKIKLSFYRKTKN